ncbi:ABC transporter permease [Kitasatospora sp. NPDC096147]|uniref:ABC transporter permease n=1 Tax=Kitasatospora sp. NPDC096147 TaxID=3364093 RepID=UPI0037FBB9AC
MLRTTLRSLLAHRARLVVTTLAIVLGVAFVSGTLVFGDTVTGALRGAAAQDLRGVAVLVQARSTADPERPDGPGRHTPLTAELADRVRTVPGVATLRVAVEGTATVAAQDGSSLNAGRYQDNLAANFSPDPAAGGRDPRYPLGAGRAPAAEGELALDRRTAERGGYALGAPVRLAVDGPTLTKTLVGIVDTDDPKVTAGATLVLFDTATAQRLLLSPGRFDALGIGSAPGTDDRALADRIRAVLPAEGITVTAGAQLAEEQAAQIEASTTEFTRLLLAFAGIALFVGSFVITNTFTVLVAERRRETALLRAVGASRGQVVRAVLAEAGALGLVASLLGTGLGLGVATVLPGLLGAGAELPDGPLVVTPGTVLRSLLVGVGVTLVAAWLPARRAARTAPVEALTSAELPPAARDLRLRNVLGGLLTGAGAAVLLYVSAQHTGQEENLLAAGLGALLLLVGLIVIAPLLAGPVIRLAGAGTARLFGVTGLIARENALRNPRRTAATASALMIGLSLISALTVVGSSTEAALREAAVAGLTADRKVSLSGREGLDPDAAARLAAVPGVTAAVPLAEAAFRTPGGWTTVTGADPAGLAAVSDLEFTSGSLAAVGPGRVALSDGLADEAGLRAGDTFVGRLGEAADRQWTVAGVYRQTRAFGGALATLPETLPQAPRERIGAVLLRTGPGTSGAALERDVRAALGGSPLLEVETRQQLIRRQTGEIGTVLAMVAGLLAMTVVIAVFGVVNTLALAVFERTREIGLLRAIGLDARGVRRTVRLESVVIAVFGTVLGVGTGVFMAWACGGLSSASLPQYTTVLPWDRLGLFLLLGPVVGVLAAVWPARRAARVPLLSAIGAR